MTKNKMTPRGRNPQATMVWLGDSDRAIVLNSDGELILTRLSASGYQELSRTKIIGPTGPTPLTRVTGSMPAAIRSWFAPRW